VEQKRLKPLNGFAFQKVMGEKGNEEQLLAFLNAVLSRTGKDNLTSVEILEDKDLPAEIAGGKAERLDVLGLLKDCGWVNVEVQIKNECNMDKRTLINYSAVARFQNFFLLSSALTTNFLPERLTQTENDAILS
jgi:predicted transposase/invertase (TIGR01784 family)